MKKLIFVEFEDAAFDFSSYDVREKVDALLGFDDLNYRIKEALAVSDNSFDPHLGWALLFENAAQAQLAVAALKTKIAFVFPRLVADFRSLAMKVSYREAAQNWLSAKVELDVTNVSAVFLKHFMGEVAVIAGAPVEFEDELEETLWKEKVALLCEKSHMFSPLWAELDAPW